MALRPCVICGGSHADKRRGKSQSLREATRRCLLGTAKKDGQLKIACKEAMRRRDGRKCQWCGRENLYGVDEQMSHVIRKSQSQRLKFDLWNVKTLCASCHWRWHKCDAEGAMWFLATFPDRWAYLQEQRLSDVGGTIPLEWYIERLQWLREWEPEPKEDGDGVSDV